MPRPKWLVVAQNEYRIHTSGIRSLRRIFPILAGGGLIAYVTVIAPLMVDLFLDELLAFFVSQIALAMVPIIIFLIFAYSLLIPIMYTLQAMQTKQLELLLTAPIKASDVLVGEFIGMTPFYAIVITLLAGFFSATLQPLGLSGVQTAIIALVFVLVVLSALWIGSVLAALLRTKFGQLANTRDIGRGLGLVLGLPMIALMYAIMGGGLLEALSDPSTQGLIRTILNVIPSTWGADIIMSFATTPGTVSTDVLLRLGGLSLFFASSLWLGTVVARRAYRLEAVSFTASQAKPDGVFYLAIKALGGGGSFSTLLASVWKTYGRRFENLSRILYVIAVIVLVNVFFGGAKEDLEDALIMTQFLLPFLSVFVVGQVTLGGRETLFMYRKAPSGVRRLVNARLVQSWLIVVPIAVVATVVSLLALPSLTLGTLLTTMGLVVVVTAAYTALSLGLALLNPDFSESSRDQMLGLIVNANIVMFLAIGLFFASILVLKIPFLYTLGLQAAVTWILSIIVLVVGREKLRRLE